MRNILLIAYLILGIIYICLFYHFERHPIKETPVQHILDWEKDMTDAGYIKVGNTWIRQR